MPHAGDDKSRSESKNGRENRSSTHARVETGKQGGILIGPRSSAQCLLPGLTATRRSAIRQSVPPRKATAGPSRRLADGRGAKPGANPAEHGKEMDGKAWRFSIESNCGMQSGLMNTGQYVPRFSQ